MHIKSLKVSEFKPFTELNLTLPGRPRVVVLCGENGSGKSSVLDAISVWRQSHAFGLSDMGFYAPGANPSAGGISVELTFHEDVQNPKAAVYVRTAQRVTVEFDAHKASNRRSGGIDDRGPSRSIDLDDRINEDYHELIGASVEALWSEQYSEATAGEITEKLVGDIADPLQRLIPGLRFDGPDNPYSPESTLRFSRGDHSRYPYKNLSGGEKAVFDLLIDVVVKRASFGNAIWCIDEPELHINPRIQGECLRELVELMNPNGQLWIATHSVGMLAEARRMQEKSPEAVAFMDFTNTDFTRPVTVEPKAIDRQFWRRMLKVALGDLADLLAPERIVLCEGRRGTTAVSEGANWDARVLEEIFGSAYPSTAFLSVGNADEVKRDRIGVAAATEALVDGVQTIRVIDRDLRSDSERDDLMIEGCRVLRRRHLESYLLDGEVLDRLCEEYGQPEKKSELRRLLEESVSESSECGNDPDDVKAASGRFHVKARKLLSMHKSGSSASVFLRDIVAPCIEPTMNVYQELRDDIFGGEPPAGE